MKTLLLALTLLISGSAWADWVLIGTSSATDFFIDPTTIRKDGNRRKIWSLQDQKQRDKRGFLSIRTRFEFDCIEGKATMLAISTHSGAMGAGDTLSFEQFSLPEWYDTPPNTSLEAIQKVSCAQ
jgi:hypothetical protein